MSDFTIEADWLEAEELQGAELRATWCTLAIRVRDSVPSRVFSHRARTVRDEVVLSAYPLAEWLATSWWRLFEQRENPFRVTSTAFQESHSLRFAREGYALPDLSIVSQGRECRLNWSGGRLDPYGVEFLSSGGAVISTEDVRTTLSEFVDQVVARLVESGVEGTLLQEEWEAIRGLDADEAEYCVVLASVGIDPFSADEGEASIVADAYESLPENVARELSAVTEGAEMGAAAVRISRVLGELQANGLTLEEPIALKSTLEAVGEVGPNGTPWAIGYAQARLLRDTLGLNGEPVGSLDRLADLLGEDHERVEEMAQGRQFNLELLNGISSTNEDGAFALQLAPTHPNGRLFHFSRALGGYLFGGDRSVALTRASSDVQRRFRAFAAEFLAPSSALRAQVSRDTVDQDEVEELAGSFGVSPILIHHQLHNHQIAQTSMVMGDRMPDS